MNTPHHYESRMAYHHHNTPCIHCGKTARNANHQVEQVVDPCGFCGEAYEAHRAASGNTAPFCMALASRPGDTFIRSAKEAK